MGRASCNNWSYSIPGSTPGASRLGCRARQQIYVICGACHGSLALGEERLGAPSLVGQQDTYLLRQLRKFRVGMRGGKGDDQARQMRLILVLYLMSLIGRP
jgi:cytochrome c553